jgi:putative transposase
MKIATCLARSRPPKPPNITISPSLISVNGLEKVELMQKKLQEDITSISSQMKNQIETPQIHQCNMSSIQEFLQENKKETSSDSQIISSDSIQTIPLSKILEAESIIKDQDFKPFWNNYSSEISKKLWLPTLIDSPDSDMTSFNGCSSISEQYWSMWTSQNKSLVKNSLETSWKFSPSLQPATTEAENTSNIVTRKIKIFPNYQQKLLFQKCLQAHRYFYNKAVEVINNTYDDRKEEFHNHPTCVHCDQPKVENTFTCNKHVKKALPWKPNISLISLRKKIMKPDSELKGTSDEWQTYVPYDTRQLAIKDAVSAYKACITNKMRGNINTFELKYKNRKHTRHICWIDSAAIRVKGKRIQIFPTRLGKEDKYIRIRKRETEKLPVQFEHDCVLAHDNGAYCIIYTSTRKEDTHSDHTSNLISLDPGIRTFQTGFSPEGDAIKMGNFYETGLDNLHNKLDKYRSLRDKNHGRTRYTLKRRCRNIELQIKNKVFNLHNQIGSFLARNYKTILLPLFGTSVMQKGSELSSTVKRRLWTLSHYKFQNKMINLCNRYNSKLYIIDESFTTKTCGNCGILNEVGSNKVFKCNNCTYCMDRDVHGARNILIKTLTSYSTDN